MSDERPLPPWSRWAFALLGAALLLSVLAILVDESTTEWRGWRARFAALPANDAERAAAEAPEPGIRQLWVPELGRADRCTTCHLGSDDPALATASQPFRSHAADWLESHPPRRFGCSACHGGQGAATTFEGAAHEAIPHWPDPMRPLAFMGARCGRCHRERSPPRAPLLAAGRALVAESNCVGCHEIPGFSPDEVRAPRLDGLADKLQEGWLRRWLAEPTAYLSASRMPDFRLSDQEVRDLDAFLLDQRGPELPEAAVDWSRGDPERGATVFRVARCVTCHALDGRGGGIGPELTRVGSKVRREWLWAWLQDPHRHQPETLMPRFRLGEGDLLDLVTYLSEDLVDFGDPGPPPPEGRGDVEQGREVFLRRGCHGCHALTDLPERPRIGPTLADLDSRPFDAERLRTLGIAPSLPNWIFTKLRTPETLAAEAKMPTFGFSESDAAAVTLAVASAVGRPPPEGWRTEAAPIAAYEPQGEFGVLVRRFRCLSCHSARGFGGTLSTVAFDRIGSQLRRPYLETYLQNPIAVRVSVEARMPRLGIDATEARVLAEYLATVFREDAFDAAPPVDPGLVEPGRRLYDELGCVGCHIVGGQGGYVGPDLSDAGNRLQPGWVVAFLREPERWKPGTLQPDYGLGDEDLRALSAYVASLRTPAEAAR